MGGEDSIIQCSLCPCRFFSEEDYLDHMVAFGVENDHLAKFKQIHHIYYGRW